jgi:hypothetical protein
MVVATVVLSAGTVVTVVDGARVVVVSPVVDGVVGSSSPGAVVEGEGDGDGLTGSGNRSSMVTGSHILAAAASGDGAPTTSRAATTMDEPTRAAPSLPCMVGKGNAGSRGWEPDDRQVRWRAMKSSRRFASVIGSMLLATTVAACDNGETALSSTSSVIAGPSTTADATTTSVAGGGGGATTTLVGETVGDDYEIVARESDPAGETLYIVIPPGAYTDVDIENFMFELFDSGTATFGAEVFDDAAAVDAYRKPEAERTEDETALIAAHHLASLENGTTIVFRGPFESSGEMVIGS